MILGQKEKDTERKRDKEKEKQRERKRSSLSSSQCKRLAGTMAVWRGKRRFIASDLAEWCSVNLRFEIFENGWTYVYVGETTGSGDRQGGRGVAEKRDRVDRLYRENTSVRGAGAREIGFRDVAVLYLELASLIAQ